MTTKTKRLIMHDLLYRRGYRWTSTGWTKEINSHGLGLLSYEQEINRRGGRQYGRDSAALLNAEISDVQMYVHAGRASDSEEEWLADALKC